MTLELGREIEVAQARDGRRTRRRTSPSTRARASRRRRRRAPTTATSGASLVDVGLERDAPVARGATARARTPGSDRRSRPRRRSSPCGCTGDDVSPLASSPLRRRRLPVDAGDERQVVAVERRSWRPRRRGATRRAGRARRACRRPRRWLDDRVAELALEAARAARRAAVVERVRVGRDRPRSARASTSASGVAR